MKSIYKTLGLVIAPGRLGLGTKPNINMREQYRCNNYTLLGFASSTQPMNLIINFGGNQLDGIVEGWETEERIDIKKACIVNKDCLP
jgi:hypothetical protein